MDASVRLEEGGYGNRIVVRPNGLNGGTFTCTEKFIGDEFCVDNYENITRPTISKTIGLSTPTIKKESPNTTGINIDYNNTNPITFTVKPFTSIGETFEWTIPCGWTGPNGATGTFTSTSRSIQVVPSGYSGPGEKIKVRALLNCDGSPTYTDPIDWSITWSGSSSPTITGNPEACFNKVTYYSIAAPSGQAITWTLSSKLIFDGSSTANPVKVKAATKSTTGTATIIASIESSSCGTVYYLDTIEVWTGRPTGVITNPSGVPAIEASVGNWVVIQATSIPGATASSLNWWTNNSSALDLNVGYSNCSVECLQTGYNFVYVTSLNGCGTSPYRQIPIDVTTGGGGGMFMVVGPNPVGNELDVEFSNKDTSKSLAYDEFETPLEYVITDRNGTVVLTKQTKKTKHTLNLMSIREPGVYVLSAYNLDGSLIEQLKLLLDR